MQRKETSFVLWLSWAIPDMGRRGSAGPTKKASGQFEIL